MRESEDFPMQKLTGLISWLFDGHWFGSWPAETADFRRLRRRQP